MTTLAELKASRMLDIAARTQATLAKGYTYPTLGVTVSLSLEAQIRYQGLSQLSTLLATITIEAFDPLQAPMQLTSFLQIGPFVSAVNQYIRDVWEAHNTLCTAVRNAASIPAVEAILDTRPP